MPGLPPTPADLQEGQAAIAPSAVASPSGDYRVSALLGGYKWGISNISFSFYAGGSYYGSETGLGQVSDAVKSNVRYILSEIISPLINVTFTEVSDTPTSYGLIRYLTSANPGYAYAYYPYSTDSNQGTSSDRAGDVHLNPAYDAAGSDSNYFRLGPGSHGFNTLIHETGHALGLKHPGDYNGGGTGDGPFLPLGEDNFDNSLMTYNFYSGETPATPMAYDVLALQHLYGAKTSTRSTDTTYAFTAVDRFSPGSGSTGSPTAIYDEAKHTLWDGGGTDTIDVSALPALTSGYRIDVRPGGWITRTVGYNASGYSATSGSPTSFSSGSTYFSTDYGTRIALSGTVVENIVVSRSSDTIFLNDAANRISGYAPGVANGSDVIHGSNQLDTLDLSLFPQPNVGATQVGNDLSLNLGVAGTVTIKDYYAVSSASRMTILYKANTAPTDVGLSAATIAENAGANAVVGTLTTTDPDTGDTFTYTLVTGTGSTDNAAFNISSNQLRATASLDFETKSSYSVRVRSTDQGGLFTEKTFTITVADANELLALKQANAKRPFLPLWHGECAQSLSGRRRIGRSSGSDCRKFHVDLGCTSCGQG